MELKMYNNRTGNFILAKQFKERPRLTSKLNYFKGKITLKIKKYIILTNPYSSFLLCKKNNSFIFFYISASLYLNVSANLKNL